MGIRRIVKLKSTIKLPEKKYIKNTCGWFRE